MCFLWGTNWIFIYYLEEIQSLKGFEAKSVLDLGIKWMPTNQLHAPADSPSVHIKLEASGGGGGSRICLYEVQSRKVPAPTENRIPVVQP
jgi:hypothetical protein